MSVSSPERGRSNRRRRRQERRSQTRVWGGASRALRDVGSL